MDMPPPDALFLFQDLQVDFFFSASTLGEPAESRTFDGLSAEVEIDVPADLEFLSARLVGHEALSPEFSPVEINEYGLLVSEDSKLEGYFLVRDSRKLAINLAFGSKGMEDPNKAVIVAFVRDCKGRPVSGAIFELIDGETNTPVETGAQPGMPRVSYSHLGLPTAECTFSSDQQVVSQFMLIDAPVNVVDGANVHPYRLRMLGRKQASDIEPVMLAEREVELFAGGTTYVRLFR
jgi:hypothetical protein